MAIIDTCQVQFLVKKQLTLLPTDTAPPWSGNGSTHHMGTAADTDAALHALLPALPDVHRARWIPAFTASLRRRPA